MQSAVMFGAGNIGRGFLGQLFSESGYEVVFFDVDEPLIDWINRHHGYTIRLVNNEWTDEVKIAPVRAYHSKEIEVVSAELAHCGIAATAVGARVLPILAPLVASGIIRRFQVNPDSPLNIIICENLKDAAVSFRAMVLEHIPEEYTNSFNTCVGFVDTVIGRMVPPPTPEMRSENPSLIVVEPYKELPVDKAGFIGEIPAIAGMEACENFPVYTARKLYIHNCGHAFLAYMGFIKGYEYGYEALKDVMIRRLFEQVLSESIKGIVAAYPVAPEWLRKHQEELTLRFANRSLGDTVFRLGRDPIRKLAPKDRLVGAARLAQNAGIIPNALCLGIAAGYCFDAEDDPISRELQEYIQSSGIKAALERYSGLSGDDPLTENVLENYSRLIYQINNKGI